uniref:Mammalian cell entry related domain protein n=1 Tax=Rhodopseudomonas palustris (strain BisA53) TaxID=316055 RepID=Q07QU6_RHOP5
METRAPFILVGAFVLAAIGAVFGFVFWLHNSSGLGARTSYQVHFNGSVPGLLVGAAVLFNGIRVGEVTALGLAPDDPRQVNASIAVDVATPVRADTKVGLDFQGLTGVPVIALEGGSQKTASGPVPTLIADPGAGQSMTQAARDALRKVDSVLTENAEPLKAAIADIRVFAESLARNSGKLDGIVAGIERMTGADKPVVNKVIYDLATPTDFTPGKPIRGQLAIAEPSAVVMLDTQRILTAPGLDFPQLAGVQWSDSIPKMLQAKLIQSFENYDIAHAPIKANDMVSADHQLAIDLHGFEIAGDPPQAAIALAAKLLDKDGKVMTAKLFRVNRPLDKVEPLAALAAFNAAFSELAKDLVGWTVAALDAPTPEPAHTEPPARQRR